MNEFNGYLYKILSSYRYAHNPNYENFYKNKTQFLKSYEEMFNIDKDEEIIEQTIDSIIIPYDGFISPILDSFSFFLSKNDSKYYFIKVIFKDQIGWVLLKREHGLKTNSFRIVEELEINTIND